MAESEDRSLEQRVARLEAKLDDLARRLDQIPGTTPQPVAPPPVAPARPSMPAVPPIPSAAAPPPAYKQPEPGFRLPEHMRRWEYWLNKLGIALLLFGVAFFFKYSIDRGWLTPWIRVAFGLVLGVALIVLGLRIYEKRRHFSLVLLGGGIATFYITGFASFQILHLVSHTLALGFMVAVTALAFAISLRQSEAILSLIGILGGLGTPFLLYTGTGDVPGLVMYTVTLLAATVLIYFFRGWRSVLWASVVGGWLVMFVVHAASHTFPDRVAAQWGLGSVWLLFWFLPVLREVVSVSNPGRWPKSFLGLGDQGLAAPTREVMDRHVHALAVSSPILTLVTSLTLWPGRHDHAWAAVALGGAIVYGLVAWWLTRYDSLRPLSYTHGAVAAMLFTLALCLYFHGGTLLFALSTEAAVLHLVAIRRNDSVMNFGAHLLSAAVGFWLFVRLTLWRELADHPSTADLLTDIWVIAVMAALSHLLRHVIERRFYLIFAMAATALLLIRELDGNALLLSLLVQMIILHLVAKWQQDTAITIAGHIGFGALAVWLFVRLVSPQAGDAVVFNANALVDLVVIAAAATLCRVFNSTAEKGTYLLAAHVALLLWLLRELHGLVDGQGYVTIAWGVYAVALLLIGLRRNLRRLQQVALGTLLVVVGKLFLVDLAKLETIWRVLLFICFGGVFLALSYWFQSLWKRKTAD